MSKRRTYPKLLLVEGAKDRRIIPYLMEKNGIPWERDAEPVHICDISGNDISAADAAAYYKQPDLSVLGVILDADSDAGSAWRKIRDVFTPLVPSLPPVIAGGGFVSETAPGGIRFGAWIMPDNRSCGMFETFMRYLVRPDSESLWEYACGAAEIASRDFSAPYKIAHGDKAKMHTFLAWQDEPGAQLHEAINFAILNPTSSYCKPFVSWFKELFDVG